MQKTDIDDPAFDLASMNKEFLSVNLKDLRVRRLSRSSYGRRCHDHEFRDNALKASVSTTKRCMRAIPPRLGADARLWEYGPER